MTEKPPPIPSPKGDDGPLSHKSDDELDRAANAHQEEVFVRWLRKRQAVMGYTDAQVDEMIRQYQQTHGHEGARGAQ